jgi:hypothetical protein
VVHLAISARLPREQFSGRRRVAPQLEACGLCLSLTFESSSVEIKGSLNAGDGWKRPKQCDLTKVLVRLMR